MMDRTFNYAGIRPQSMGSETYVDDAAKAYRDAQMPRWLQSKQQALDLTNMLMKTRAQYEPQMFQERLRGLDMANQSAAENLKFQPQMLAEKLRGLGLGNAMTSENLSFLPAMMQAKLALLTAQANKVNNPMTSATGLSPMGKLFREYNNLLHGMSPDGGTKLDPQIASKMADMYLFQMVKKGLTAKQQNQLSAGNRAEITLNSINPDDLNTYNGPQGKLQYAKDVADSMSGNPSERFQKYQVAIRLAQELGKQFIGTYGLSIQPSQAKSINEMMNPNTLKMDPQTASIGFNAFAQSLRTELQNLRDQAIDPMSLLQAQGQNVFGGQTPSDQNQSQLPSFVTGNSATGSSSGLRTIFTDKNDYDSYISGLSASDKAKLKQLLKNAGGG